MSTCLATSFQVGLARAAPGSAERRRDGAGTARTPDDAGSLELLADRVRMNARLGTDLAQGPALGERSAARINVHRDTVASLSRKRQAR